MEIYKVTGSHTYRTHDSNIRADVLTLTVCLVFLGLLTKETGESLSDRYRELTLHILNDSIARGNVLFK